MKRTHQYGTITEAINAYRQKGYVVDFNLEENCIICGNDKYNVDDFEIIEVYHYEGMTDPADEATVYAIASNKGVKGILVTGYGPNIEPMSAALLQKLNFQK